MPSCVWEKFASFQFNHLVPFSGLVKATSVLHTTPITVTRRVQHHITSTVISTPGHLQHKTALQRLLSTTCYFHSEPDCVTPAPTEHTQPIPSPITPNNLVHQPLQTNTHILSHSSSDTPNPTRVLSSAMTTTTTTTTTTLGFVTPHSMFCHRPVFASLIPLVSREV
ncbi:hypothetical protein E2C01_045049 [Portunus trituberculatus]|uniref:Uncharacterized protein n=1 Tax=Portunus trituberculatus TaxID=210409 RepID=A0A5B7G0R7_PORTR|nr:hypothetical protein [Portunus trituberculatus]